LDFFLVCDNAPDVIERLAVALGGYQELARANPRLATARRQRNHMLAVRTAAR
jgi:hypothetical protein